MLTKSNFKIIQARKDILSKIRNSLPYFLKPSEFFGEANPRFIENYPLAILTDLRKLPADRSKKRPFNIHTLEIPRNDVMSTSRIADNAKRMIEDMNWDNERNKIIWIPLIYDRYSEIQIKNIIKKFMEHPNTDGEYIDLSGVLQMRLSKESELEEYVKEDIIAKLDTNEERKVKTFEQMISNNKILYQPEKRILLIITYGPSEKGSLISSASLPIFLIVNTLFKEDLEKGSHVNPDFLNDCKALYDAFLEDKLEVCTQIRQKMENALITPAEDEKLKNEILRRLQQSITSSIENYQNQLNAIESDILNLFNKKTAIKQKLMATAQLNENDHLLSKLIEMQEKFDNLLEVQIIPVNKELLIAKIWVLGPVRIEREFIHSNFLRDLPELKFYQLIDEGKITFYMYGAIQIQFINGVFSGVEPFKVEGNSIPIPLTELNTYAITRNPHHFHYSCLGTFRSEITKAVQADNPFATLLTSIQAVTSLNLSDGAARGKINPDSMIIHDLETKTVKSYKQYLKEHKQ